MANLRSRLEVAGSWRDGLNPRKAMFLLCAVLVATSYLSLPSTVAAGDFNGQLFTAVRDAGSGAALCGLGSTPVITSTVRSLLDCSNQCVGLVSGGGNCSAFNYWQNNRACQMFAAFPSCQAVQLYCTLYQVRDHSVCSLTNFAVQPYQHSLLGDRSVC